MMASEGERFPVVVITGPIGVGKTTVALALGDLLADRAVPHTVIDMDWLRNTYPRPTDDRFNSRLGHRNLATVVRNSRAAGSERAVIADVVESRQDRERYRRAIPGAEAQVVRLAVDEAVNRERIARRANGDDDPWEYHRAVELAGIMTANDIADLTIDTTGKGPKLVAAEIAAWLGWLPEDAIGCGD